MRGFAALTLNINRRLLVCALTTLALMMLLLGTLAGCGEKEGTTVPQTGAPTDSGPQAKVQLLLFTQPG
jgi:predicted small lipoprotein YifL